MIAIIIGTRAELIKTFPIMLEFDKQKIPYRFIHTGQHNLGKLCEDFGIKKPDVILTKEPESGSKFFSKIGKAVFWNLGLIFKIRKELKKIKDLRYVIYHGDTMTTMSAAIASSRILNFSKKHKSVHLEAGLRSFDLLEPFPEEISRRVCDKFSDVLLSVSDSSSNNLKKKNNVKKVGNTIVDSANIAYGIALEREIKGFSGDYALVSIHRHENIKKLED